VGKRTNFYPFTKTLKESDRLAHLYGHLTYPLAHLLRSQNKTIVVC